MPNSCARSLISLLASAGLCIGLAACSSCDEGDGNGAIGTVPDTTSDAGDIGDTGGETDGACGSDDDCSGSTPVCNTESGTCVECTEGGDCASGQVCDTDAQECVASQCGSGSSGESCDPSLDAGEGWSCVDAGNGPVCMKSCSMSDGSSCSGTEICMRTGERSASAVCFPSQCQGPTDTQNCDGVDEHPRFRSYSNGAKCVNYSEDALLPSSISDRLEDCGSASLCVPSGTQGTGDACNVVTTGDCEEGQGCQACNAENTCQGRICRSICTSDSECGSQENSCLGLDNNDVVGEDVGFCAESCDLYDGQQDCNSMGEGCQRLTNNIGYCGEVGEKGNMERCTRGANECAEGLTCLGLRSEGAGSVVSRCLPECAPAGRDESIRRAAAGCGGTYHGRAAYAHGDPATVDIYANGNRLVDDLAPGATESGVMNADYFELDVDALNRGSVAIDVTDGSASDASNPELTEDIFASSGLVETWLVHWNGQLAITPIPIRRSVTQPGTGAMVGKIQGGTVVPDFESNGSAVDVDLVAVPQGGSLSSDKVVLGEELGSEALGEAFAEIEAGSFTLYAFPESANHQMSNKIAEVSGLQVGARERATFVLNGTADDSDSVGVEAVKLPYAEAPAAPRWSCVALGAGYCLNECRESDYGTDWCGENSSCAPFQGNTPPSYCLADGGATRDPGDDCTLRTLAPSCKEGARCSVDGSGQGKCRSLCVGGSDDSEGDLTCESAQTCSAARGEVGPCLNSCTPGQNMEDTSCPENLQACVTNVVGEEGDGQAAFCSASGTNEQGDECGGSGDPLTSLLQNCEPGTMCAHGTGIKDSLRLALQGMFLEKPRVSAGVCRQSVDNPTAPRPTCRPTCEPFADDPGCPDGEACGLDLANGTPLNGVCLEEGDNIDSPASETKCQDNIGKMCGDASYCLPQPASGGVIRRCFEFCNANTDEGCTEGECEELRGFGVGIGLCRL